MSRGRGGEPDRGGASFEAAADCSKRAEDRLRMPGGRTLLAEDFVNSARESPAEPQSQDLGYRPGEGRASGDRVSGMKLGRQALNGQVEAQRYTFR